MLEPDLPPLCALMALAALVACAPSEPAPSLSGQYRGKDILLVSIDSLRADRLGCYGYEKATPTIDALALRSVVFDSMFTTSSTTLPAHASLLTGRNPGDLRNGYSLADSALTLAEVLSRNGYQARAFVSSLPLDDSFNLGQGFRVYDSDFSECSGTIQSRDGKWHDQGFEVYDCNAWETTQRVLAALDADDGKDSNKPSLLWVHYFDPHFPYQPPDGFYDEAKVSRWGFPFFHQATPADVESLNQLYDGEIAFLDNQLGALFQGLDERGMLKDTVVLVVSDHGENLYDHDDYLDHSMVVYETVMRIPALLALPGRAGARLAGLASITDLMPTLLELVGVKLDPVEAAALAGRSLVPMIESSDVAVRDFVVCETNDYGVAKEDQAIAIRSEDTKLILNHWKRGGRALFDLRADPGETESLSRLPAASDAVLRGYEQAWLAEAQAPPMVKKTELDESMRRGLKSLGYLQSE